MALMIRTTTTIAVVLADRRTTRFGGGTHRIRVCPAAGTASLKNGVRLPIQLSRNMRSGKVICHERMAELRRGNKHLSVCCLLAMVTSADRRTTTKICLSTSGLHGLGRTMVPGYPDLGLRAFSRFLVWVSNSLSAVERKDTYKFNTKLRDSYHPPFFKVVFFLIR
jgi:hypothetical protein